ncbi:unnamed protein product [Paramecium pentaurelia]|uniref:RNB domain-containing protein n=1 Tax=Paramecium pentaurelia TaxID=43138 RepID=A0A8S1TRH8_9CILI|nr:unnamed protein product [Paramecium pentaurelia]
MKVQLNSQPRLNKRLQVMIQAKEVYLSSDIPCQIRGCAFCTQESEIQLENPIFLLDNEILEQYIDLIEQSNINNIVILQSQVAHFRKRQQQSQYAQQVINLIESNFQKKIYVYQDEFSIHTQNGNPLILLAKWYNEHRQFLKVELDLCLLTQNYQMHQQSKNLNIKCFTIQDYVKLYENNDLLDFLGMDEEYEQDQQAINNQFPYIQVEECVQQIKQGLLFEGRISIDRNNIKQARIFVKQFQLEIKINQQNRVLHGDRVAVELLPEDQWEQQQKQIQITFDEEDEDDGNNNTHTNDTSHEIMSTNHLQSLFRKVQAQNLIPYGKVVCVLQRTERHFCGHVENNIFVPADGRYPNFILKHSKYDTLQDKKIQVQFVDWPIWSDKPLCKLKKVLGKAGDMYIEGNVILLEHQVEIREFSHQVLACLPIEGDKYKISEQEIKRRMDLRDILVCSIDPVGCKDIDDTLHCRRLENNLYEVGVHIADVSHFVRPDTAIDKEAAHRCTTVYLVDRRTDMLPKLLTENLCSLVSNVDRLAFSVIWIMDDQANIKDVKFGKSVIRSIASLHYQQAQEMIDNPNDNSQLTQSIRLLNMLAKKLKQLRLDQGALSLASNQVKFSFDDETHNPSDVRMYQLYDTNSLVEEFMLLANCSVASQILQRFPSISVLRRHQEPKMKQLKELQILMNDLGYQFSYDTSKLLSESLNQIQRPNDTFFNKLIRMITTRCMNEALYVCTADVDYPELYHYGLAAELYTHFTSPIRRYADVLVHRLLAASIDLESLPPSMSNKIRMTRICDKLNMRHRMARFASRASSDYHTYLFFKNRTQQIDQAIITGILADKVTVMIPRYGLEGTIEAQIIDRMNIIIQGIRHRIFDYIQVEVSVELHSFHKKIHMKYMKNNK